MRIEVGTPGTTPSASPEVLLEHWRRTGDPEALGVLFDATSGVLFRIALGLTGDAALAEDALQQTWLQALRKLRRHDPTRPVTPWLVGFLTRNARKAVRHARRRPVAERWRGARGEAARSEDAAPDVEVEATRKALEALEEPYRSVALLRWRYGLEPSEIAHVRAEPPGTVRSLLSRALGKLRRALTPLALLGLGAAASRGLPAVRADVLRASIGLGPPLALLGGALAMKKVLVTIGALLLLGLGVRHALVDTPEDRPELEGREGSPLLTRTEQAGRAPALEGSGRPVAGARPTDAPRAGAIPVRVTREDGSPVAGADVWALAGGAKELFDGDLAPAAPGIAGRAVTDAEGRCALPVSAGLSSTTLVAHEVATGSVAVRALAAVGTEAVLVLTGSGTLTGRVLDAQGKHVAGARVVATTVLESWRTQRTAQSDAQGRYVLSQLAWPEAAGQGSVSAYRCLEAEAEGYAPLFLESVVPVPAPGASATFDLVLGRGMVLDGRVLDGDGDRALARVRVALSSFEGQWWIESASGVKARAPRARRVLAETLSDAQGAFRFEHVPAVGFHGSEASSGGRRGPLVGQVNATLTGYAPAQEEVPLVKEGERSEATLRMWPAASLRGRVLHADGTPAAGAQVWAQVEGLRGRTEGNTPSATAYASQDGTFLMEGIAALAELPTSVHVRFALALAYRGQPRVQLAETAERVLELRGGGELDLGDVRLVEPAMLEARLRVLTADGSPAAQATAYSGFMWGRFRADAEGRVRMLWAAEGSMAPTGPVEVSVLSPGWVAARLQVRPSRPVGPETEVRLQQGHALAGQVLDATGAPAAGAWVSVLDGTVPLAQAGHVDPGGPPLPGPQAGGQFGQTSADPEGRFRVEDLPAGPYHVVAGAPTPDGALPTEEGAHTSRSAVATNATDLVLRLPADARRGPGALDVVVVDEAGTPVVGARLQALRPGDERDASAASPGTFRLRGLPLGTWTLSLTAPDFVGLQRDVEITVPAGEPTVLRLTLSQGVTAWGIARVEGGGVAAEMYVAVSHLSPPGPPIVGPNVRTSADGTWRMGGLLPGRYRLSSPSARPYDPAAPARFAREGALLDIPADAREMRHDVLLAPGGTLHVEVQDDRVPAAMGGLGTGAPVAWVTILAGDGTEVAREPVRQRGPCLGLTWLVLPSGTYHVRLAAADALLTEQSVEISVGKTAQVQL